MNDKQFSDEILRRIGARVIEIGDWDKAESDALIIAYKEMLRLLDAQ